MSENKKFVLDHPIEHDGAVIKALIVREPQRKDLNKLVASSKRFEEASSAELNETRFAIYAFVTGLDRALLDELDFADIQRLDVMLNEMIARSLRHVSAPGLGSRGPNRNRNHRK